MKELDVPVLAWPEGRGRADDEVAIRAIVGQIEQGWNGHDGDAFAAPFAEDADYIIVDGGYIKGRAAIAAGHRQIFSTIYRDSRNAATIEGVRFLRDDVAVARVRWHLAYRVADTDHTGDAINQLLLTKGDGRWSVAIFQNTPIVRRER